MQSQFAVRCSRPKSLGVFDDSGLSQVRPPDANPYSRSGFDPSVKILGRNRLSAAPAPQFT